MTTTQTLQVLEIPLSIYDASTERYRRLTLYFDAKKSQTGTWYERMLDAQNSGKRVAYSSEWFLGRRYLQQANPQAEEDFITEQLEWTGTVLDYEHEQLLEGITLEPNGDIADVKTRLGKKEGFQLPQKGGYVKDMSDRHMKTISYIWGVQNPKRDLPDYAYLWVVPGFRPVVRGGWGMHLRGRRVDASADFVAVDKRFAARYVSETRHQIITEIPKPEETGEAKK